MNGNVNWGKQWIVLLVGKWKKYILGDNMDTVEVYVEYDWLCPVCETRQMETIRKSELICESCGTRDES